MNQATQIHQIPTNKDAHILVISCPFQGHAAPLMKLSNQIAKFGTKVTFLTTSSIHLRLTSATSNQSQYLDNGISIISVPDGLDSEDDRRDQKKLHASIQRVMPGYLEEFLKKSNDRVSGVIVDSPLAWMMEIPKKMGIKIGVFWCSTPGCLALGINIPHLMESKFCDDDGTPLKNEKIQPLPNMPAMSTSDLVWYFPGDKNIQKSIFHVTKDIIHHMIKNADWILCNWFHELYPESSTLPPNLLPIGPLLANGQSTGSFCSEDSTCISWLDKQPEKSVIYVAFGSTSRFTEQQLMELANGLDLTGRPFLLVGWSGLTDGSFASVEFAKRVADRGKIVEWAPQEVVLGHPSTGCFITHCGWSSVMESLSNGVPLACWTYFADQMYSQTCICDAWKVGVRLQPDESGMLSRHEIKQKVEELMSDGIIRENSLRLMGMARNSISEGGSSLVNLEHVINQMKF